MKNPRWEKFINEQIRKWKMIVAENMLKNRGHPVFVVYYEHLKTSHLLQVTIDTQVKVLTACIGTTISAGTASTGVLAVSIFKESSDFSS